MFLLLWPLDLMNSMLRNYVFIYSYNTYSLSTFCLLFIMLYLVTKKGWLWFFFFWQQKKKNPKFQNMYVLHCIITCNWKQKSCETIFSSATVLYIFQISFLTWHSSDWAHSKYSKISIHNSVFTWSRNKGACNSLINMIHSTQYVL